MMYRDLLATWWAVYRLPLADTTIHRKEDEMRAHILPFLGDYEAEKITTEMLQNFVDDLRQHGSPIRHPGPLAPGTVVTIFHTVFSSLVYGVEKSIIQKNPATDVCLPRVVPPEIEVFNPKEIQQLVTAARPKWFGDVILLAARTGMRRGEIYGLQWSDVDFENKFAMIRRSIEAIKQGDFLIHPTKTRGSRRRVALDNVSLEALQRRKENAKSEWVIENQHGCPISPWITTKYMAMACSTAQIPRRRFHTLRHSHATYLLSKGINPKIVQERLGHATITTTLETYSHVLPTMQGAVIDVLNHDGADDPKK